MKKNAIAVTINTVPDWSRIDKIAERLGLEREAMFERYAVMPSDRNALRLVRAMGAPEADLEIAEKWPPSLMRITGIGVAGAVPDKNAGYVLKRRVFTGQNELTILGAFSAFAFAGLDADNGQDTDRFPTFIGSRLRSDVMGPILARTELLLSEANGIARSGVQGASVVQYATNLVRVWYDESDKWGKYRPNYMMDRDPNMVDIDLCEAGGAWAGRNEFLSALSPAWQKGPETSDEMDDATFWETRSKALLYRAGQMLERYCRHSDLAFGTNMIQCIGSELKFNLWDADVCLPQRKAEVGELFKEAGEVAFFVFGGYPERERLKETEQSNRNEGELGYNVGQDRT